jgi:hypothetical protein
MSKNKFESEQLENKQEGSPAKPTPPPETPAEADQRRLAELDASIPPHEESAQSTAEQLETVINQLNAEPPRVEISTQNATADSLAQMREEKSDILARQETSGIAPEPKIPDPERPYETPVNVEASREQMQAFLQSEMKKALTEIPTEIKVLQATSAELSAEQIAKLPSWQKIRDTFRGSKEALPEEVSTKILELSEKIAADIKNNENSQVSPDQVITWGLKTFDEEIKAAAAENPDKKQSSSFEKTQEEKQAKYTRVGQQPVRGRHTQRREDEGLRPNT